LTVGGNHPTSVRLSWGDVPKDQGNGIITGYSVQVEGPDTTRNIQMTTTISDRMSSTLRPLEDDLLFSTPTQTRCTFKEVCDLRPSTEYTFSVSAETVVGSGPAISVSFITPQECKA
jgi:hypothetical protein